MSDFKAKMHCVAAVRSGGPTPEPTLLLMLSVVRVVCRAQRYRCRHPTFSVSCMELPGDFSRWWADWEHDSLTTP